jgi:hypothetical protein
MAGKRPDRVAAAIMGGTDMEPNSAPVQNSTIGTDLVQQITDLENQSSTLQKQQEEVAGSSALSRMGSLPGILTMLAAGGAAAFGGKGGAQVGAGLLSGALQGAREGKLVDEQRLAQRRQETMGIIDDQRTRLVTMLQSRPEMFLDATTGKSLVDPRVLGYAATGMLIPIDPGVNYALTQRSDKAKVQTELGMQLALSGDTPEKRSQGLNILSNVMGAPFDAALKDAIETGDETTIWTNLAQSPAFNARMTLAAMSYALTSNKTLRDPDVVEMLRGAAVERTKDVDKPTMSDINVRVTQEYFDAIANLPNANELSVNDRIDYAFGSNPAKGDLMRDILKVESANSRLSPEQVMASMTSTYAQLATLMVQFPNTTERVFGIKTPDELARRAYSIYQAGVPFAIRGSQATAAQDQGNKLRSMEESIISVYTYLNPLEATMQATQAMKAIRDKATKNGLVDNAAFAAGVAAFVKNPYLQGAPNTTTTTPFRPYTLGSEQ